MNELDLITRLSTIGGLAVIAWALRPIWTAIGKWISKKTDDNRITELQEFRETAESNHFHDLEDLKADRRDVWNRLNAMDKSYQDFRVDVVSRLSRLESRIFNGQQKH